MDDQGKVDGVLTTLAVALMAKQPEYNKHHGEFLEHEDVLHFQVLNFHIAPHQEQPLCTSTVPIFLFVFAVFEGPTSAANDRQRKLQIKDCLTE